MGHAVFKVASEFEWNRSQVSPKVLERFFSIGALQQNGKIEEKEIIIFVIQTLNSKVTSKVT